MNRLLNITGACDFTIGGIGVGGGDVTGGAEDFAHVLGEVKTVGVPCAILLDGQWASGYGLGRVPRDEPHGVERGARQVDGCDLEVVAVEEAQMAGGAAVAFLTLEHAAPHIVVVGGDDGGAVRTLEAHGAVECVVRCQTNARACLDSGLVAVKVIRGLEIVNRGVLVQVIALIFGAACHARAGFNSGGAVADVIIIVGIGIGAKRGGGEFAAAVVRERIIPRAALAGGAARCGAGGGIVGVAALCYKGIATAVGHLHEQVSLRLVALRETHAVGLGERLQ